MIAYLLLLVLLAGVSFLCFLMERSISLFSWSRLDSLPGLSRSRRQAIERCLDEERLVTLSFSVTGSLCASAFAATVVLRWGGCMAAIPVALAVVVLISWVLPEIGAAILRDRVMAHLVPHAYRILGRPFRGIRNFYVRRRCLWGDADAQGRGDGALCPASADEEAHSVFREAVRLRHTLVRDIMTPRTEMVSVAESATPRQAAALSLESGNSRLPVYRGNRDQIVGILHVKDLLGYAASEAWDQPIIPRLMRPVYFVPEAKTIAELLRELQRMKTHMAIVLDEYGGTSGLVTLEDVIEELIGEIYDEHETAEEGQPLFRRLDDIRVDVMASMRVEDFNDEFDLDLPEQEDYDTLGGFVTYVLDHIPTVGESFRYGQARFTVRAADPRHVTAIRVEFDRPRGIRQRR